MLWTWIGLAALAAEPVADVMCPEDPRRAIVGESEQVEISFFRADTDAFSASRRRLGQLMLCVQEPLALPDVIQLHRARAIIAYVEEDLEASRRAFSALHALQPDWSLPSDQLSYEHPLWRVAEEAFQRPTTDATIGLAVTPTHGWSVDGTRYPRVDDPIDEEGRPEGTYYLPSDRAFVLQVFGDDGHVIYTGYHFSTVDIPIQDLIVLPDPSEVHRKRKVFARAIGTGVGGALLAGAAVTLGMGIDARAPVLNGELTDLNEVDRARERANLFGQTAGGLAGGGALIITLAWTIPW